MTQMIVETVLDMIAATIANLKLVIYCLCSYGFELEVAFIRTEYLKTYSNCIGIASESKVHRSGLAFVCGVLSVNRNYLVSGILP